MPATIRVNGLTLAHKGTGGYARSTLPDVCKSPGAPVPYVNTSFISTLTKGTQTVFADGGNMIAIKGSEQATSIGDEPGVGKGVKSGTQLHRATWLSWSPNVFMEGRPVNRLTDKMLMNNGNTVCLAGHWDPPVWKPDVDDNKKDLCEMACQCELDNPGAEAGVRDQCFQDKLRNRLDKNGNKAYNDEGYPTPDTMKNGFLCNVVYIKTATEWIMKTSGKYEGLPSTNPFVGGSRRPDVTCRVDGQTSEIVEMKFGGDKATKGQIDDYPQIGETKFIYVDKDCDCGNYKKKKEAEAKEAKEAEQSSDLMRKMSEMTGLTGVALLIYVIISEGSRLFPPRNLVPVP
jgi:hypothetical protein